MYKLAEKQEDKSVSASITTFWQSMVRPPKPPISPSKAPTLVSTGKPDNSASAPEKSSTARDTFKQAGWTVGRSKVNDLLDKRVAGSSGQGVLKQ